MAEQIPGARYVELPGVDIFMIVGDSDALADEMEEFLTGEHTHRGTDRVLATVLFTDIVGSTRKADELGDEKWRYLIDAHHGVVRRLLARFNGREIDTAGDGFLITFDGPARAVRCATAIRDAVRDLGIEIHAGSTRVRWSYVEIPSRAWPSTSAPASPHWPDRARCSRRAP